VVDLTDFGQAVEALSGIDDRHDGSTRWCTGRIPAPAANQRGNVRQQHDRVVQRLQRGDTCGVRKIVWASSETVLGLPFDEPPPYVPVDEDYPPRPNSTYSLSRRLEEEIARQLCRWHPTCR